MNKTVVFEGEEIVISENLNCPVFTNTTLYVDAQLSFWVGGILNCLIGIPGFLINVVSAYVLLTNSARKNTFNSLLSILLIIDSICLFFIVVGVLTSNFGLRSRIYDILYPYFFHPFRIISLTSSIFMTIGIAHERYRAIQYPVQHRQTRSSAKFRRKLLAKYVLVVILCATLINFPKFFEAELDWKCNQHNSSGSLIRNSDITNRNR